MCGVDCRGNTANQSRLALPFQLPRPIDADASRPPTVVDLPQRSKKRSQLVTVHRQDGGEILEHDDPEFSDLKKQPAGGVFGAFLR
jgi:hypothetical protein